MFRVSEFVANEEPQERGSRKESPHDSNVHPARRVVKSWSGVKPAPFGICSLGIAVEQRRCEPAGAVPAGRSPEGMRLREKPTWRSQKEEALVAL